MFKILNFKVVGLYLIYYDNEIRLLLFRETWLAVRGRRGLQLMKGEGGLLENNLFNGQIRERGFITELDSSKAHGSLRSPTVSVVIPAFNEEKNVAKVLSGTIEVMDQLNLPYEIIFVDDGSTDKTALIASSFKVNVITNKQNRGKGYSLKRALQHASGDVIVTIDSDGEHKPKEIAPLLGAVLNGIDVAAGSRFLSNHTGVTSKLNQIGNHFFNLTIMSLTGKRVTDSQTGFRAIKRDVLEKLNLQSDGYEIETEITVKSLKNGFTFRELPITVERRKFGASKLKIIEDGKRIMETILTTSFSS
jgi:glycosyltransferase involved in cell wall biosynthesis